MRHAAAGVPHVVSGGAKRYLRSMAEPPQIDDGPAGAGTHASPQQVIALVDDDRNILTSVSIGLQAEGFATRVYADGETALKALLENLPDLAVC